jgi:hypothetical protein
MRVAAKLFDCPLIVLNHIGFNGINYLCASLRSLRLIYCIVCFFEMQPKQNSSGFMKQFFSKV